MAIGAKEIKQIKILAGFVVICLLIAGFIFRDNFMPSPSNSGRMLPDAVRFTLPTGEAQRLFDRSDYKELKAFGDVPVVAKEYGSAKIFD